MNALLATAHRPWPLPARPWIMTQTWHDLLFAHWPVSVQALAPLIPPGLSLETFGGQAWVGVVPFRMSGIRLRGVLGIPTATQFPEINVRTYVQRGGKPGVYFLSLDAASRLAVEGARWVFRMPYFLARMAVGRDGEWITYETRRTDRRGPAARFAGRYRPTGEVMLTRPGTLEHWLTERYCLYAADRRGRIWRGEIHHAPWPLQPAEAEIGQNTMALAGGVRLPETPPLLHFARRLEVLVWPLAVP